MDLLASSTFRIWILFDDYDRYHSICWLF